jgi:outer membrane lipoprotein-sorting protein
MSAGLMAMDFGSTYTQPPRHHRDKHMSSGKATGIAPARIGIMLIAVLLATNAFADEVDEGLQEILAAQSGIKSLSAAFTQRKTLSLFDETIEARGTIVIEKPDFYCWTYEEPERSVFYVDESRSGSFQPETGERNEVALESRVGLAAIIRSITAIITGNLEASTRKDFEISLNSAADHSLSFNFRPRAEELQSLFEQVTIRFDRKTSLARDLEILEHNGDITTMQFDDWRSNITVDRSSLLR